MLYIFRASTLENPLYEKARQTVALAMGKIYEGWNNDLDRQFDRSAIYFTLQDAESSHIHSTCRVIFARSPNGERVNSFPLDFASPPSPVPTSEKFCEGGGVSFKTPHAARHLMYCVGIWLYANDIGDLYTTYDILNPLIKRFYTKTCGMELVPDAVVTFRKFTSAETGKTVSWQVVRGTHKSLPQRIQYLEHQVAIDTINDATGVLQVWHQRKTT